MNDNTNLKKISFKELMLFDNYKNLKLSHKKKIKSKSTKEILREFQVDKWGNLLSIFSKKEIFSLYDVENEEIDLSKNVVCFDKINGFFITASHNAVDYQILLYKKVLQKYIPTSSALVELGAGYGNKLFKLSLMPEFKNLPLYAGEFTTSGCQLVERLSKILKKTVTVKKFDFNNPNLRELCIPDDAIVFTSFSLMYSKKNHDVFLKQLLGFKPKCIIFFEPCYEFLNKNNKHEKLCRKYLELNGYNINFTSAILSTCSSLGLDVRIKKNWFGINPFLPLSIIEISFK